MESQESRDEKMRERVAISAIYGQRVHEEIYETSEGSMEPRPEMRLCDGPMVAAAHCDTKHEASGMRGSFLAALKVTSDAKAKRDELLAKYAAEHE
jgi:hypothetical protein